jgi:Zn-dependent metalloprotease
MKEEGGKALKEILVDFLGATGEEEIHPASNQFRETHKLSKTTQNSNGRLHIRYDHFIDGIKVEGASMMLHISEEEGMIYAVNGEFAPIHSNSTPKRLRSLEASLDCKDAMERAIQQLGRSRAVVGPECKLSAVYGNDGFFHKAWKAYVSYEAGPEQNDRYELDEVFASLSTGDLLASFPTVHGGLSLEIRDCNGTENICSLVSQSTETINVTDTDTEYAHAVALAHIYSKDAYDYFYSEFGRDSVDGRGFPLISRVNFGNQYINAFWNGWSFTYGTGSRYFFRPFSFAADVVYHEITHALTHFTSHLIYAGESGALNEAMSDIFAAVIERVKRKKSPADNWLIAEDLFRISGANAGFRNMAFPSQKGSVDYYPDIIPSDSVHGSSGVMNLAFVLAVQGGSHPRALTTGHVPPIDSDFDTSIRIAARIFYMANTACLTPQSQFADARSCTLLHAGPYSDNIAKAWDAVGVVDKSQSPLPRSPRKSLNLLDCVSRIRSRCGCRLAPTNCWKAIGQRQCRASLQWVRRAWMNSCRSRIRRLSWHPGIKRRML